MIGKTHIINTVAIAALATATKAVGSGFRAGIDYKNAPPEAKTDEFKREATLLSLAFISNLLVQACFGKGKSQMGRLLLTLPGTIVAEAVSRFVGKPPQWGHKPFDLLEKLDFYG